MECFLYTTCRIICAVIGWLVRSVITFYRSWADLGEGCRGCAPPPETTLGPLVLHIFLNYPLDSSQYFITLALHPLPLEE